MIYIHGELNPDLCKLKPLPEDTMNESSTFQDGLVAREDSVLQPHQRRKPQCSSHGRKHHGMGVSNFGHESWMDTPFWDMTMYPLVI